MLSSRLILLLIFFYSFLFAENPFLIEHSEKNYYERPRIAIIIDDVSNENEIRMIKKIPYKVTPSFFPPTSAFPNTPYLAKKFEFYMVHLPLEAKNFFKVQPRTLHIKDSEKTILKEIERIKRLFPRVKYLNNHTGSAFTSNYNAMFKLYDVFNREGLIFVDSRTIGSTKARDMAEVFDNEFLQRDVFLDNIQNEEYIINQLKKAIMIAKKEGYAIAIGHPYKTTLNVLRRVKYLFRGVDVVYVKDLI